MASTEVERIQSLLSGEASAFRDELTKLGFEALVALPVGRLIDPDKLSELVVTALAESSAAPFARDLVMPAVKRVTAQLATRPERIADVFSPKGAAELKRIVMAGKGPRFGWLSGAVDQNELQKIVGPIVQDVLLKFVAKLPLPGMSGGGGGGSGGKSGGLLGALGKQVQKSAGQLADVGKSVLGGLGGELERRVSAAARDFSAAASGDIKSAIGTRLRSDEGQRSVVKIREGVVDHILKAKLADATTDFLRLPVDDIGALVVDALNHLRAQPLLRELLDAEVRATIAALGERTARDFLEQAGLLDEARAAATKAVDPGIRALSATPEFGDWLERLLAAGRAP